MSFMRLLMPVVLLALLAPSVHALSPTPTATFTPCANDIDGDEVCDEREARNYDVTFQPQSSNVLLPDSDGDGLTDGEEDANRNGQPDFGETLARNADSDGDSFEDGLEVIFLGSDPLDPNDPGVPFVDNDNDRLPDFVDPDDNILDVDGDRFDDLYDAVVFRDLAAAQDNSRVPHLGDINGDGVASGLDALVIQALFLHSIDHTNQVFQAPGMGYDGFRFADPSLDGQFTNLDSLLIHGHLHGRLLAFPFRM